MDVGVSLLREGAQCPEYQTDGAAGFDLSSAEHMVVMPGMLALVPTGLVMQIPKDHVLLIFARSSLAIKKHLMLANGVGVIDSDYCGAEDEIKLLLINMTPEPVTILKGDRLAQGLILPIDRARFVGYVPRETSRGGFGSTDGYAAPEPNLVVIP